MSHASSILLAGHPSLTDAIAATLRSEGWSVRQFRSAGELAEGALQAPSSVIVMAPRLEDSTCLGAFHRLGTQGRGCIALVAEDLAGARDGLLRTGFADVFVSPVKASDFTARLNQLVEGDSVEHLGETRLPMSAEIHVQSARYSGAGVLTELGEQTARLTLPPEAAVTAGTPLRVWLPAGGPGLFVSVIASTFEGAVVRYIALTAEERESFAEWRSRHVVAPSGGLWPSVLSSTEQALGQLRRAQLPEGGAAAEVFGGLTDFHRALLAGDDTVFGDVPSERRAELRRSFLSGIALRVRAAEALHEGASLASSGGLVETSELAATLRAELQQWLGIVQGEISEMFANGFLTVVQELNALQTALREAAARLDGMESTFAAQRLEAEEQRARASAIVQEAREPAATAAFAVPAKKGSRSKKMLLVALVFLVLLAALGAVLRFVVFPAGQAAPTAADGAVHATEALPGAP